MKRLTTASVVLLIIAQIGFAAPRGFGWLGVPRWTFDGGAGLSYDQTTLPSGATEVAPPSYNLRGEIFGDFTYHFNRRFGFGWETGLGFFPSTLTMNGINQSYAQFDVPVLVFLMGQAGPFFIQPLSGLLFMDSSPSLPGASGALQVGYDLGIRGGFGGPFFRLFAEASYVMGPTSFPRFGFGGMVRLFGS